MVNLSSSRIGATTDDTLHENLVGNIEEKEAIRRNSSSGKSIGLSRGSRESIEKPSTLLAIRLVKTILDLSCVGVESIKHCIFLFVAPHINEVGVGDGERAS